MGSCAFAVMALLTESLKEHYTFAWITMVRSGVATFMAIMLAIAWRAQLVLFKPSTLWMRSLAGWASMICGFYAMTHYDVAIVLSITNMFPIWVALLSWPMLRQVPTRTTWIALTVCTAGVWMVYSSAHAPQGPAGDVRNVPQIAIPLALMSAMLSGVALIGLHRIQNVDPRAIVAHFSGISTLLSLAVWVAVPVHEATRATDSASIGRLVGVGIAAGFGQLFLTRAFAAGPPARVSVVGLSQVVIAGLAKWQLEGRVPSIWSLCGMAMVVAATCSVMLQREDLDHDCE